MEINKLTAPQAIDGDYMAATVMSALHSQKGGTMLKSEVFDSCVNRISQQMTFHAVEAIQERIAANEAAKKAATGQLPQESSGHGLTLVENEN